MTTIFICIDWFYPAFKAGGPVQSVANLVARYHRPGTRFKIYCSNTDLDGTVLTGVAFDEWITFNAYTEVRYVSRANLTIAAIKREVKHTKADILFINGIYSWHFNFVPLFFCKVPLKIISVRGMLHSGALAQKPFKKKVYLWCWKMLGLHRRNRFHASNNDEKQFIQNTFGKTTSISVASNFPRSFSVQAPGYKIAGNLQLVSVALISAMKNYLPVLQALEHCTEMINYAIYGPVKDPGYWQQCLEQVKQLPANIRVQYHGDLDPTKIEEALKGSQVFILPSKSENFGHAIYEALSAGKPVVTSDKTPWNNLFKHNAGINVTVERTGELENAIRFFAAMNAEEFSKWNKGAREYAVKAIDLRAIQLQYDHMFAVD
ncbi:MAG: glycosyltransferase [Ferruginibacter sp.]